MAASPTRLPNWAERLVKYITWCRDYPGGLKFGWDPSNQGTANCLTFAGGAVEAQTGINYYENMAAAEEYNDIAAAKLILNARGFSSVDQLIGSIFEPKKVTHATFGDLIIIPANNEMVPGIELVGMNQAVAVAEPPHYWCISSKFGLSKGHMRDAVKAYNV